MTPSTHSAKLPHNRLLAAGTALVLLSAIAGIVFGLLRPQAQADAMLAPAAATPVSVATVTPSEVAIWAEFSGQLEAVDPVDLRARVAGTVQSVHFREGALVHKGDLLISIDPAPYASDLKRAEAQVVAAQARQSLTRSALDQTRRPLDEAALAQPADDGLADGEHANAQREAEANLRATQAVLQTARLRLGYTRVRAPMAGRVGKIEIAAGSPVLAGPGAPVLTRLWSVSPVYASFDADAQAVPRALRDLPTSGRARSQIAGIAVQMGTAATTDTPHRGRLQWVDSQVDASRDTVRMRAVFDNKDGVLRPGQSARLRLGQLQTSQALLIDERAVGTDQRRKFVTVVDADNKAVWREVTLGASVDGLRIVTSGLQPGERIVVNGLQRIRPGALLAPQPVPMQTRAAAQRAATQRA